jgi:hypothetical protein
LVPRNRIDATRLLLRDVEGRGLMDLVDSERSALRIGCAGETRGGVPRDRMLRVALVVRPGERHDSRPHEATQVVDVPSGLVLVDPLAQPEDPVHAQVLAQVPLDLLARPAGIAIRVEEALLGCEERAFPSTSMDPPSSTNGRRVAGVALHLEHLLADESSWSHWA